MNNDDKSMEISYNSEQNKIRIATLARTTVSKTELFEKSLKLVLMVPLPFGIEQRWQNE